jgi:membrane protein DedA with SNARE-associated domain
MEHFVVRFAQNGYLAVFVLMVLESACIPIPSEITMLFAGALCSAAFATVAPGAPRLNVVAVILVGTVANLVGSLLAYGIGRAIGRGPLDRYGKYVLIRTHDIDKAEAWWSRHGQGAVFFGRLLPVVRTFISLPAGIAEMPAGRFAAYTFAGSLPWVAALGAAGYALGRSWNTIIRSFNVASLAIVGVLVVAAAAYLIRRRSARAAT